MTESISPGTVALSSLEPIEPAKTILIPLANGVSLDLIYIPGGVFQMGSPANEPDRDDRKPIREREGPQHQVKVPAFYIGKYPVTQAQWYAVSQLKEQDLPLEPRPSRFEGDSLPVEQVSWQEAMEFCKRLSTYTTGEYRLPSEAEWEYACRAKTTTPFAFGNSLKKILGKRANFKSAQTTPVGQYPANDFGLYDMHGNVWEWCLDEWHENYNGAPTDGSAWQDNTPNSEHQDRVRRGGSWFDGPWLCRSAYRNCHPSCFQFGNLGFRVIYVLSDTHHTYNEKEI